MIINDLPLPALLCQLVEAQAWTLPDDATLFREATKVENPDEFNFLDFDGMQRETNAARSLAADSAMARLYGLKPLGGSEISSSQDGLLDVEKAVIVAVNWDEDAIFLDYRQSTEPSIVLSSWCDDTRHVDCRLLALNFDEFARRVGLPLAQIKAPEQD